MKNKLNEIDYISVDMEYNEGFDEDISDNDLFKKIKKLTDINLRGRDGRTILIHAALYGRFKIVKWLVKNGADVRMKCSLGFTALHAAVDSDNYQIAEFLLKNCDVNVNEKDNYGNTPLMRTHHYNIKMIKLLMKYGADSTMCNNYGNSPLTSYEAYPEIIKVLKGE